MAATEQREGPDLERIGLFKEMTYLEQHVPIKVDFSKSSKGGKQMMTHCLRSMNATLDGYFDKSYPRVFEGEAYADPIRQRRLHRLQEAKKNLGKDFKYASPTKKQCGSGSNYGTFGALDGQKTEYFSSKPNEVEPVPPPLKNFYVNPTKKGTGYGYPNVTISKDPPYMLEKEYEELKKISEIPRKQKFRNFEPYRAGAFQQGFFDPNPYQTNNAEESYLKDEDEEDEMEVEAKEIFRPTGPAKKDGGMKDGCFSKFPGYVGDPIVPVEKEKKELHTNKKPVFRPVPGPKPYPIKSIITKNVQRKVTPQNFTSVKGVVYCKNNKQQKLSKP